MFEAVDEGVEAGQVVSADRLDALRELVTLELGEHLPERADVPREGIEFGAAGKDGFELQALALRQGVGVSQDPAGDIAVGPTAFRPEKGAFRVLGASWCVGMCPWMSGSRPAGGRAGKA
ncbi:hypothetical protein OG782_36865 [Streptomyces sp. NBC_00876]|uniref:hypothetical protein n=1 Tax=Streptomyces sp. NBC_00876 TaxID=2975853 RepID=UPI00387020F8|nr:hypothetical protein OG782_36865 [Streptomyces sp. NBC_00876]